MSQLYIVLYVCLTYIVHYVLSCTNIVIASILSIFRPCSLGSFHTFNMGALQHDVTTRFFTNQCHLYNSIWHVSMWPKNLRTSNKTGGFQNGGTSQHFCPAAMGTPKPSLKSLLRKGDLLVAPGVFDARLQFEVYQFCWPLMVQVQQNSINHGCILLYFGWVLLKLIDKLNKIYMNVLDVVCGG